MDRRLFGLATAATALYMLRVFYRRLWTKHAAIRRDLAAAHLLSSHHKYDELVWNHISCRLPDEPSAFLITPGTQLFDEVTPESLVVSSDSNANVTGDVIHRAIYEARPDINAIVHHHSIPVVAVGLLPEGLRCLTQDASSFFGKVSYYEWEGLSDDYEEKKRIADALGSGSHTLIMRNHGACTMGRTVAEAWVRYFYLDIVCKQQLAVHGLPKVVEPSDETFKHGAAQMSEPPFVHGHSEWEALFRLAQRLDLERAPWWRKMLGVGYL